ncbi:MAG TPA: hypothetical protein VGB55_02740 [Tepidisphaeraceae bacterium]|jgi:hypothetical protein
MGYQIFQCATRFYIAANNVAAAMAALRALHGREPIHDSSGPHFSFVDTAAFLKANTLSEALAAWRWDVGELAADGSVAELGFIGEKHGDEDILFAALAPFVQSGSHIDMFGEDGAAWRWSFEDGAMHRRSGTVHFEPVTEANRVRLEHWPGATGRGTPRPVPSSDKEDTVL